MSQNFIEKMAMLYQQTPSPVLVSVRLAQACLESGYGQSDLARHAYNFAGIKASPPWTGETYRKVSNEEIDGKLVGQPSAFRKYDSVKAFVEDHSAFFTSTEKRKVIYKQVLESVTYQGQCASLTNTYATDSQYGKKLISIIEQYNLTQYDVATDINVGTKSVQEEKTMATKPNMVDRRKQALGYPGHGAYRKRSLSEIENIVWHYTATKHEGSGVTIIKNHEAYWRNHHGWDIGGYHYYIDRQGVIYWNYDWNVVSYGAGIANPYSLHISLEASHKDNYTPAQIKAREQLTLWLLQELGLPADRVRGHKEMAGNSTDCPGYSVAELNAYRQDLAKKLKGGNDRQVKIADYKTPSKPFDALKVGDTVTIRQGMACWYDPQNVAGIKASKDFTGDKDVIVKVIDVNIGYSKRAYLLKEKVSWILEQDLVEARQSWQAVAEKDLKPTGNYAQIDGKYYKIEEVK